MVLNRTKRFSSFPNWSDSSKVSSLRILFLLWKHFETLRTGDALETSWKCIGKRSRDDSHLWEPAAWAVIGPLVKFRSTWQFEPLRGEDVFVTGNQMPRLARQWFLLRLALRSQRLLWHGTGEVLWLQEYQGRWFRQILQHDGRSLSQDQETGAKKVKNMFVSILQYLLGNFSKTSSCLRHPAAKALAQSCSFGQQGGLLGRQEGHLLNGCTNETMGIDEPCVPMGNPLTINVWIGMCETGCETGPSPARCLSTAPTRDNFHRLLTCHWHRAKLASLLIGVDGVDVNYCISICCFHRFPVIFGSLFLFRSI